MATGLKLGGPDDLDFIGGHAASMHGTWPEIFQMLAWVCLICAPLACMVISLLYVVWIFTFTNFKSREPFSFPKRLFTLPVSTGFLVSRLITGGTVAVLLIYLGWTQLVHLPSVEAFDGFNHALAWIALLILAQAIFWSLDAFPFTRVLLLVTSAFCLFVHPAFQWCRSLAPHENAIQLILIVGGSGMAFIGLGKIRHGDWQRWIWQWPPAHLTERTEIRGPAAFRSAAQAQFWFEWRRHGRTIFYTVCVLAIAPAVAFIPEILLHPAPENADPTCGLCFYLLAVPLFIHFMHGVSYERALPPFTANLPLNNGAIIAAQWQVMAFTTVLSWVVTLLLLGVVLLIGDASTINASLHLPPHPRPLIAALLFGMIICTWVCGVDRVWVGAVQGTWIHRVYGMIIWIVAGLGGAWLFAVMHPGTAFHETFFQYFPVLLGFLLALKFFLAQWSFRTAMNRKVFARPLLLRYLGIWTALATLALTSATVAPHQKDGMFVLYLTIILLLPLARIGFAPIALDRARHR